MKSRDPLSQVRYEDVTIFVGVITRIEWVLVLVIYLSGCILIIHLHLLVIKFAGCDSSKLRHISFLELSWGHVSLHFTSATQACDNCWNLFYMLVVIVRRISKRWFQFLVFLPLLLLKFFRALWLQQIHEKSVYIRVVLLPSQSLLISEVLLMQLLLLIHYFRSVCGS